MRTARFAAVLAVMLVTRVAGVAWGDNGQPLILGRTNTAERATTLNGGLWINGGLDVVGNLGSNSANVLSTDGQANFSGWVSMSPGAHNR